jgi:hypothetical protein
MSFETTLNELRLPLEKFISDNSHQLTRHDASSKEYKSLAEKIEAAKETWNSVQLFFRYTRDKETWQHLENLDDPNNFSIFGKHELITDPKIYEFLFDHTEKYFLQNNFRLREFDWFFLNFIIAAYYRIYLSESSGANLSKSYPKLHAAIEGFDGSNFLVLMRYALWKILKNSVAIYFLFVLFSLSTEDKSWLAVIATILIAAKLFSWYSQFRKWNSLLDESKNNLKKIKNLYYLLENGITNFDLIIEDLKNLRLNGIEFPTNIYVAICEGRCSYTH